jgi:hypothetical protein
MSYDFLSPAELDEFSRSFERVIELMRRFQKRLTPRELLVLQMGMRASHVEEALAHGDSERARAHLAMLVAMIRDAPL